MSTPVYGRSFASCMMIMEQTPRAKARFLSPSKRSFPSPTKTSRSASRRRVPRAGRLGRVEMLASLGPFFSGSPGFFPGPESPESSFRGFNCSMRSSKYSWKESNSRKSLLLRYSQSVFTASPSAVICRADAKNSDILTRQLIDLEAVLFFSKSATHQTGICAALLRTKMRLNTNPTTLTAQAVSSSVSGQVPLMLIASIFKPAQPM
mmetsp:Transcript_6841/g.15564  ORF Transcript_6841/g.15564 Transcript_6841/m.15564 type:complete len:207 (+) Transcript_6841:349-969(+)